ncbi:hypothetical protein KFL_006170060 [Klebsormidium nitens]|uniref:Amidohydrolase-related domain-containing protein n=1 Tax=Klebsormidium nitens TaxID=105231 RepID=A0A1Y1IQ18_KLENI|nr:hypothetical protein KFL_006170060 [Klebsormidium nitens]|eukprot:GAQ90238.1 hypothetical protein KFL_006170060 [Klebsormidium nitens]
MLFRGFTTVRDAGGCDWGLAKAVDEGTLIGPRILFSGHALSQTGGHGDMRERGDEALVSCGCCHGTNVTLGRVCDGVPEVRKAARDELRKGASQIKIMASGGVASPTDRLSNLQFSIEETKALVEEASNAGTYVCAHAYTAQAIRRALECGVRSIEHGNLIDAETLDLLIAKDAFLVPTLVTYDRIRAEGVEAGMPAALVDKVADILERGVEALALADGKGAQICFGSDLLGTMHKHQSAEFAIRSRVQTPEAILRSATATFAELTGLQGKVGCIAEGAYADLVVVAKEKSPLDDITVLCNPESILMVVKDGRIELDRRRKQ